MTFKEPYTKYYSYQEDNVKPTTFKRCRDRIKYMQLLDNVKLKDLGVKHHELWRKKSINLILAQHIKMIHKNLLK